MDINELFEKYKALLIENNYLREKVKSMHIQLGLDELQDDLADASINKHKPEILVTESNQNEISNSSITLNKRSDSAEKIKLFMSLFRGRDDVYAKRWENPKKEISGYSPACANEWKPSICQKPKISCTACKNKNYLVFNEAVVENHLRGRNNFVAGIYPMLLNETCYFLAIDFDDEGWQKDITTLREICYELNIPILIERSRSGKGAHAWFFFEHPIAASIARKFGSALLTYAMNKWHEITFKFYDRLFPNQDNMPKGGFGNLIALPLQKVAREYNNSVFIDDFFQPFIDQWATLATITKLSENDLEILISKLCQGNELGMLKKDTEEITKPWETDKIELRKDDFPKKLEIIKANMLFITKVGLSQRAMNQLKRLAAFRNPEFYKAQAMRMSTFNKPRIISCADETIEYLCLPRGCYADINEISEELGLEIYWKDHTNVGRKIDVEFNGHLREDQPLAISKLLKHDNGILCGTTAFGKTIAAIKLIAERKVNTLCLVLK